MVKPRARVARRAWLAGRDLVDGPWDELSRRMTPDEGPDERPRWTASRPRDSGLVEMSTTRNWAQGRPRFARP